VLLLAAACSLQQPAGARLSPPAALPQAAATPTVDAGTSAHPAVISLDALRPMSTRASFQTLSRAVELGNDPKALDAIRAQLLTINAPAPELQRVHLWLAYAYRKRGNALQALFHFQAASRVEWALAGYARFGSAEASTALGRPEEALRDLAELKTSEPLATNAELLRAQILAQTGYVASAIPIWRSYVARTPSSDPKRAQVGLLLAEALVSLSTRQTRPAAPGFQPSEPTLAADAFHQEAFELLDPVRNKGLDADAQQRALEIRQALVSVVFAGQLGQQQQCKLSDRINELETLVEQREITHALEVAQALLDQLQPEQRYSVEGCRILFCLGQLKSWKGEGSAGAAAFDGVADNCAAPDDLVARALYQSGRRRLELHDAPAAIARFEELQNRFALHRLADDARLKAANAYLELGSVSKFIDLIQRMPEDFPQGDQVPEALFQLALHRMVKGDWSGAASVLANLGQLPRVAKREDPEQAERQQYFLARAQLALGQKEQGLTQWVSLVKERPFSYYMLLAHSRLSKLAPELAEQARALATAQTTRSPFEVPYQTELDVPGFARAIELMALGEMDAASDELRLLNLPKDIEPELLWARASFEAAAGDFKASQRIVRERFRSWPRFWPAGAWEAAWRLAYPQPYYDIVRHESARTGVPAALVYAVMREESQFDHEAVSAADAYGLMQLIVPTAQRAGKDLGLSVNARALKRPELNVALGSQVLKGLLDKFKNKPLLAIAGYNAGPGRPVRWMKERPDLDQDIWVETIPFFETRTYVKHVVASWSAYAWLYDREAVESLLHLPERMND
jgi:soluble lytic murein transglycosylase